MRGRRYRFVAARCDFLLPVVVQLIGIPAQPDRHAGHKQAPSGGPVFAPRRRQGFSGQPEPISGRPESVFRMERGSSRQSSWTPPRPSGVWQRPPRTSEQPFDSRDDCRASGIDRPKVSPSRPPFSPDRPGSPSGHEGLARSRPESDGNRQNSPPVDRKRYPVARMNPSVIRAWGRE